MFIKIQELIENLSRRRLDKIEVFIPNANNDIDLKQVIYKSIKSKKVTKESEILTFLDYKNKTDKAYLMFLSRFRKKLLNLFFFLDLEKSFREESSMAEVKALKYYTLAKILRIANANKNALSLFQKTIIIARKYDFTALLANAMQGYINTGTRLVVGSYLKQYLKEYPTIKQQAEDLDLAEYCLNWIYYTYRTPLFFKKEGIDIVKKYRDKITLIKNDYDNFRLVEIKFIADVYYYQIIKDYEQIFIIGFHYEKEIRKHAKSKNRHKRQFILTMMLYFLFHEKYKEGLFFYDKHKKNYKKDSKAYIGFVEYFLKLCLVTKNYKKAKEIIYKTYALRSYNTISKKQKERWQVYEPYVLFAINPKLLTEAKKRKFMFFLKYNPENAKDKLGYNLQLLIAKFIYHLALKDIDALITMKQSFKMYNYKYFKIKNNSVHKRTYYFLKILEILLRDSKKQMVLKKSKKYFNKMQELVKDKTMFDTYYEIIPYENLWEIILKEWYDNIKVSLLKRQSEKKALLKAQKK